MPSSQLLGSVKQASLGKKRDPLSKITREKGLAE
jgi:hypothetical protein